MAAKAYSQTIYDKLSDYYRKYYHNDLGLPDYEERIKNRLNEEDTVEQQIRKAERLAGIKFKEGMRVLVAGSGTGAELAIFRKLGCDVVGVEPNPEAIEISQLKLKELGEDPGIAIEGTLEDLKFDDQEFDFVYCWTVIEHVQDLEKSIANLIRTCKDDGHVFLQTPDYRMFYEGHYKLSLPMFLPKFLIKAILMLIGRPYSFIDSLQFVTTRKLRNIFKRSNVTALEVNFPYPNGFLEENGIKKRILVFFSDFLEIQKDQYWLLKK